MLTEDKAELQNNLFWFATAYKGNFQETMKHYQFRLNDQNFKILHLHDSLPPIWATAFCHILARVARHLLRKKA